MHPSSPVLPVMLCFHALLTPEITAYKSYFTSHGAFNNSCPVAECKTCGTGQYRLGCANISGGTCANCTRIPNATFITHGWFNNSCEFVCNNGYAEGLGRSCIKASVQYTVNFLASVTLPNTNNQAFNLTTYINTISTLAGCGQCGSSKLNPTICGVCKLYYNVLTTVPVVYRRLLTSWSVVDVNTSIVIIDDRNLAIAVESKIISNVLNSKLTEANFGTIEVRKAPTLRSLVVLPSSPPPIMPEPSPPSTSTPGTPTRSNAEDSSMGAIVGGTIGGVVGLGCIIVLVAVLTRKGAAIAPLPQPQSLGRTGSRFTYRQVRKR